MSKIGVIERTTPDAPVLCPTEIERRATDCFVRDVDATLRELIRDVAITQRETELAPDRVLKNHRWDAMAGMDWAEHAACYRAVNSASIELA